MYIIVDINYCIIKFTNETWIRLYPSFEEATAMVELCNNTLHTKYKVFQLTVDHFELFRESCIQQHG